MADANVSLYYQGKQLSELTLGNNARLDSLLKDNQLPNDIYWRSAQISTPEQQHTVEQQQNSLIAELNMLETQWRADGKFQHANSTEHLRQQIEQLKLSGRLPITLDPYQVQRSPADNPRLEGQYQLFLAPRQPNVTLLGLIKALPTLPLTPGMGISEYWKSYALLAGADTAYVWLIQPTGNIEQVPVAIWNKLHREPMPGATMLVGFDESQLPARFEGINRRIAEIIANKVPE